MALLLNGFCDGVDSDLNVSVSSGVSNGIMGGWVRGRRWDWAFI